MRKTGPDYFRCEDPMGKPSDFGPESDDLAHQIFKSRNGVISKFNMLSTQAKLQQNDR